MDTYDEIYLKCSSMYINIRMSKSNITDSPDGNQLHVIDSSYEINKLVHFIIHCWLMPSTLRSHNSQTLWHTCRDDLSRLRRSWPLARLCVSISRCVARSYAVHVMCRTFSTPLRDVSLSQYACTTPSVIGAGAPLTLIVHWLSGLSDQHFVCTITHNYTCGSIKVTLIQLQSRQRYT